MLYEVYTIRWYFTACDLSKQQSLFESFSNLLLFLNTIPVFPNLCFATYTWKWWRKNFYLLVTHNTLVRILKIVYFVCVTTSNDNCGNVRLTEFHSKWHRHWLTRLPASQWKMTDAGKQIYRFFRQSHGRIRKIFFSLKNTWQNIESVRFTRPWKLTIETTLDMYIRVVRGITVH